MIADGRPASSRPLPSVRISENLARSLRERILRNEFVHAVLPKQEDLVQEYGVSAPSVREAFRILEAEGLITVRRGNVGGAVVHVPDANSTAHAVGLALQSEGVTLDDVSAALCRLDAFAAGACAARPDRAVAVVPALRACIEAAEAALPEPQWAKRSLGFHETMASLAGNATTHLLIRTLFALWEAHADEWTTMLGHAEYTPTPRRIAMTECHRRLLDLIAAGDVAGAEATAFEHMSQSHDSLLSRPDLGVSVARIGSARRSGR